MQLSPRLKTIANYIDKGAVVADIGTDHAYIPIYLVENNITDSIYACDINEGPLKSAKAQIEKYGFTKEIMPLLGAGLDPIVNKGVEQIIIAGMGGILISEILDQNKQVAKKAKKLILQPMIAQEELRKYLVENGFKIIDEDLAREDRRIYQIIIAKAGKSKPYNEVDYHIGPKLIEKRHILLQDLIEAKKRELKKIIKACQVGSENAILRKRQCEDLLARLEEVEKCL